MEYARASLGRIYLIKFTDGDILLDEIRALAKKEKIEAACLIFLGALRDGDVVTGPKKPVIPPEPNWISFKDGWEVLGMGTVFKGSRDPQIHIHCAMGKGHRTVTGCVRKMSRIFLVLEAVCFELKGVNATKEIDPETGLNLLRLLPVSDKRRRHTAVEI